MAKSFGKEEGLGSNVRAWRNQRRIDAKRRRRKHNPRLRKKRGHFGSSARYKRGQS